MQRESEDGYTGKLVSFPVCLWPRMLHPNPCGYLINSLIKCARLNHVEKYQLEIASVVVEQESVEQILITCPVPKSTALAELYQGSPTIGGGGGSLWGEMRLS